MVKMGGAALSQSTRLTYGHPAGGGGGGEKETKIFFFSFLQIISKQKKKKVDLILVVKKLPKTPDDELGETAFHSI